MEITDVNEKAIVSLIGKAVDDEVCTQHKSGDTLSPLPSLENLSISTESTDATSIRNKEDEDICSSEFNDCSSSVSSQDSNNFVASGNPSRVPFKRSVFSQYWQKTGQTPVILRPVKSLPTTDLASDTSDADVSNVASTHSTSSSLPYPIDRSIASMSNADFLEDHDEDDGNECEASTRGDSSLKHNSKGEVSHPPLGRRRSILPPAPVSQPALRSWKKSVSLSNVEGYSRCNNTLAHKSRSLPRMRSSSSILQPGPSCLRPFQKYSPSRPNGSKASEDQPRVSQCSPRRLMRSDSSSSSVSFQEAVDVRHFEPPRESYSEKGWSEYFK